MKVYVSTAANNNVQGKPNKNNINKDGFLQILSAQLQNQDPMNAGDNTQYVAQMAQFAALEQMQNLNESMNNLLLSQKVIEGNMMIGSTVTIDTGDEKYLTGIVTGTKAAKGNVNIIIDGKEYSVDNVVEVKDVPEEPEKPAEPAEEGSEEDVV